jgi:N-dimethylarginine dimethylaminohydrolase
MDGGESGGNGKAIARLNEPAFLLNAPFSLDTAIANNATMEKLGRAGRAIDRGRAMAQWLRLYNHLAARSLVYLLPSVAGLQDQVFVANVGAMLVHLDDPAFLVSRFRAAGRAGEAAVGRRFFDMMGVATIDAPHEFEGEADLKYLRHGIYFGGHGLRSSPAAHRFMAERFAMTVVPVPLHDPHLYHLDCILHVVDRTTVLRAIEAVATVIDVPLALAYRGATNVARVGDALLGDAKPGDGPHREIETAKLSFWERVAAATGLQPVTFDLSEFHKSGAMLSCLVLPLNAPHLRAP